MRSLLWNEKFLASIPRPFSIILPVLLSFLVVFHLSFGPNTSLLLSHRIPLHAGPYLIHCFPSSYCFHRRIASIIVLLSILVLLFIIILHMHSFYHRIAFCCHLIFYCRIAFCFVVLLSVSSSHLSFVVAFYVTLSIGYIIMYQNMISEFLPDPLGRENFKTHARHSDLTHLYTRRFQNMWPYSSSQCNCRWA
jgi:hypothetical protein